MRYQELPIIQLKPAPYNPRTISGDARARLKLSLETFDCVDPLIVNERTGFTIVGGHQRYEILKELGRETVPCVVIDVDLDHEQLMNVALNNQNMAGEYDFGKMADLLLDFDARGLDTQLTGFSDDEMTKIMNWTRGSDGGDQTNLVAQEQFGIVIKCRSEREQAELLTRLASEGLDVRALVQ